MKEYCTQFRAVDQTDGMVKLWGGPRLKAGSFDEAEKICKEQFPYLTVIGEFIEEIEFNMNDWINNN